MAEAVGWLARSTIVLVFLGACAADSVPVYAPVARAVLPRPTSAGVCANASECERRCAANEARACSELGDLIHERDWDRATGLWKHACDLHDGLGCLRAMGLHADSRADTAAARACAAGFASACGVLGRAQLLRGLARWGGPERDAMVNDAVALLERSCRLEDWTGCMTAAGAHVQTGDSDARSSARLLGARAAELADKACAGSDDVACEVLAEDRDAQGDRAGADAYYARACSLTLEVASQVSPREVEITAGAGACRRLAGRGIALPAPRAPTSGTPRVAREIIEAQRIAGLTQIKPSERARWALYKQGKNRMVSRIQVCISAVGLVDGVVVLDYSGSPGWDAAVVQAIRRWRYRPYRVGGVASPVCTMMTFIYKQR